MLTSCEVESKLEPQSCQTKDDKSSVCCFSAQHADCCFSKLALKIQLSMLV